MLIPQSDSHSEGESSKHIVKCLHQLKCISDAMQMTSTSPVPTQPLPPHRDHCANPSNSFPQKIKLDVIWKRSLGTLTTKRKTKHKPETVSYHLQITEGGTLWLMLILY